MPIGSIVGAVGNLVGGLIGKSGAEKQQQLQLQQAQANMEMQREFAQKGIRWKVDDARAAGIHPLYALGASTSSFSPVSVGSVNTSAPLAEAASSMGQDLSRAVNATRTGSERMTAFAETAAQLDLENKSLQNQLLASQIAKIRASANPPMPGPLVPEKEAFDARSRIAVGHNVISTDPGTSNVEQWQERWGEPAEWVGAPIVAWRDYLANLGIPTSAGFLEALIAASRRRFDRRLLRDEGLRRAGRPSVRGLMERR